jgi:hypothetical protein
VAQFGINIQRFVDRGVFSDLVAEQMRGTYSFIDERISTKLGSRAPVPALGSQPGAGDASGILVPSKGIVACRGIRGA